VTGEHKWKFVLLNSSCQLSTSTFI